MEFEAGLGYVKVYLKTKIIISHDYTPNLLKMAQTYDANNTSAGKYEKKNLGNLTHC